MTFYAWLQSRPDEYAFLLRKYDELRISKSTNKLCKLLRFVDRHTHTRYPDTRNALKSAHRAYREHERANRPQPTQYARLDSLLTSKGHSDLLSPAPHNSVHQCGQIIPREYKNYPEPQPRIVLSSGTLSFDEIADITDEQWNFALDLSAFPDVPERWERVYRRWSFKHRQKCAQCNDEGSGKWSSKVNGLWFCLDSEACRKRAYTCQRCGTTEMVFTTSDGIHVCTACYGYLFVMDTLVNRNED